MHLRDDSEKVLDRNIWDRVDALLDYSDELLVVLGRHWSIVSLKEGGKANLHFMGNAFDRTLPGFDPSKRNYSCHLHNMTIVANWYTNLHRLSIHKSRKNKHKNLLQGCETFRYSFQKSKTVLGKCSIKVYINEASVYHIPWSPFGLYFCSWLEQSLRS